MSLAVEQSKEGLKNIASKVFEKYGDDARIGLITYGGYYDGTRRIKRKEETLDANTRFQDRIRTVKKELPLTSQAECCGKIAEALDGLRATGGNYNREAIELAREAILDEGREDSEKYIILIGDGVAEVEGTKNAYKKASNEYGINMFSLLVGDKGIIKKYWDNIMNSLAGTDWYYSEEENTAKVLEFIAYQYILGNREFINNKEYITENGTEGGKVGTEVKLAKGKASIVGDDEERRGKSVYSLY